ncbi:MAG: hypothetical protein HY401_08225 [Elusimicrobia bacterium]|nr:hypothetical protein [Elusimicrobiota bacterium]
MKEPLLIGLDQGSSSTKGILYDSRRQKILAETRGKVSTRRRTKDDRHFVEHDPGDILRSVREAAEFLLKKAPPGSAIRVGLACQRSSFLLMEASGKALTPVVSWQDTRGAKIAQKLKKYNALVYQKTGLYLTPYYALTKLLWFFENNPHWKSRAKKGDILFAPLATYLAYHLTYEKTFAVDATHAQRSLLMNIRTCQWDKGLLKLFGIPAAMLPEIKNTTANYGTLASSPPRPLLTAMIGDQQAAAWAIFSDHERRKTALINLGTGGFVLIPTGPRPKRVPGLLSGILSKTWRAGYLLEGTVNSVQGVLVWMKNTGILKKSDVFRMPQKNEWEKIPVVVSGFGGLAAPYWRSDLKTSIFHLARATHREDFLRGFLLGLAHLFWEILRPLKGTSFYPRELIASGGLSNSAGLMKILSSYLELPIRTVRYSDLTVLGAALAARKTGKGSFIRPSRLFCPGRQDQNKLDRHRQKIHAAIKMLVNRIA